MAQWSHTSDFNIGTSAVFLPDAWCCQVRAGAWRFIVRAGTGWPGEAIPAISTLVLQQFSYRAPGVVRSELVPGVLLSELGLVGPVESYQPFQHWYFGSYPTGCLVLSGQSWCLAFYCQSWDWLARRSRTSDFNIGTSVVSLPGAWCCQVRAGAWRFIVRAGTGWPGGVIPAISSLVLR